MARRGHVCEVINIESENLAQGLALLRVSVNCPRRCALPLAVEVAVPGRASEHDRSPASTGDWGLLAGIVSDEGSRGRDSGADSEQASVDGHSRRTRGRASAKEGPVRGIWLCGNGPIDPGICPGPRIALHHWLLRAYAGKVASGRRGIVAHREASPSDETRQIGSTGPSPLCPLQDGRRFPGMRRMPEMVVIVPDPKGFIIGTPDSQAQWGRGGDEKPFGPISSPSPMRSASSSHALAVSREPW